MQIAAAHRFLCHLSLNMDSALILTVCAPLAGDASHWAGLQFCSGGLCGSRQRSGVNRCNLPPSVWYQHVSMHIAKLMHKVVCCLWGLSKLAAQHTADSSSASLRQIPTCGPAMTPGMEAASKDPGGKDQQPQKPVAALASHDTAAPLKRHAEPDTLPSRASASPNLELECRGRHRGCSGGLDPQAVARRCIAVHHRGGGVPPGGGPQAGVPGPHLPVHHRSSGSWYVFAVDFVSRPCLPVHHCPSGPRCVCTPDGASVPSAGG